MFGASHDVEPTEEDRREATATLERLAATVARGQQAAALPGTDPWPLTLQLWALVHGLASLELAGALGPPDQASQHWSQALRAIVAGYGSTG